MKVLHVSSESGWRGGEQQIAYLLDGLTRHGVQNFVAARTGSPVELHCRKNNIPCTGLPFRNSVDIPSAFGIRRVVRSLEIDLVHLHSARAHSLAVIASLFGNRVPLVLSRRVYFPPGKSWFTRWKYNHPDIRKVLCVSNKITEAMRAYLDDPAKCITVYSGVDLSRFQTPPEGRLRSEYGIGPDRFLIGNTSALEYEKDYYTFLRTIALLRDKGLPVHGFIIGKGSLEPDLKAFARKHDLERQVTFTGFRKDLESILPEIDIFLMTSTQEGLGTSVLDAFLARAAVVATSAGGIPEMVIHGKTGMLAAPGNAGELAGHIERLLTDSRLRQSIVAGATAHVRNFSKEMTAQHTFDVYKAILNA